jgi:hypothetical protein
VKTRIQSFFQIYNLYLYSLDELKARHRKLHKKQPAMHHRVYIPEVGGLQQLLNPV